MPKSKILAHSIRATGFQGALDALDVIGNWTWDGASNCIRSDMFVALLFNVDPSEAEAGLPLDTFADGIHPGDRDRVLAGFLDRGRDGGLYAAEYRVCSADGVTRWVLARGRFLNDHRGRPLSGSGIIVDITDLRVGEGGGGGDAAPGFSEAEPPLGHLRVAGSGAASAGRSAPARSGSQARRAGAARAPRADELNRGRADRVDQSRFALVRWR